MKSARWEMCLVSAVLLWGSVIGVSPALALPVAVDYTVSGSTGNWILDFSVTNNLSPSNMSLYFMGVQLSARDIVGSRASYNPNSYSTFDNTSQGGSSTIYNNIWYNSSLNTLFPGSTLSGFQAHVIDVAAPTNVAWFAYGYAGGEVYTGGGNFLNNAVNPGFEGVANQQSAVPEPGSLALLGLGLVGLMAWQWTRQGTTNT